MKLLLSAAITLLLFVLAKPALAVECEGVIPTDKGELQVFIESCQQKINQLKDEQKTLKSAIGLINSQINLTYAQIRTTTSQIGQLEIDIQALTGVITDLNFTLDDLAKIYISRIRQSYKDRNTNPLILFFSSNSFNTFQNKIKYLAIASKRDQIVLNELESAKLDLDSQKNAKEEKQSEIEKLKITLENQNKVLGVQQSQKKTLLAETENSERKYQQLKAQAQAQLAAFASFISAQGGASILTGTTKDDPGWGKYYNQRDSQWGNLLVYDQYICGPKGNEPCSVANIGCLITSMAMVMSHYGKNTTPGQIGAQSDLFSFADLKRDSLIISGISTNRTRVSWGTSTTKIDEGLKSGPVIVGISPYTGSSIPEHFLVVKAKEGNDYIVNDPFPEDGYNAKFTSRYPLSSIRTVDWVTVQ